MVAPIVIAAGVAAGAQVLAGLASAYQQKQAQKASKAELDKIRRAFENIAPPDYDMDVTDPPSIIAETAPPVDYAERITPEDFVVVGEYAPEVAPYIAEQRPDLVSDTATGREGLEAQTAALSRLREISEGGIDPQFAQRMKEASDASQMAAQSRQQSLMQDYARRGMLGSGTQLAAELSGAEGAMQRGADMSADAATQAYLNQLSALRDSANLGGNIRGQELDLASKNAAIANAFNERTSRAFQNYLANAAKTRNEAALKNLAQKQDISNLNVEERNRAAVRERNRDDLIKEKIRAQSIGNTERENLARRQRWLDDLKKKEISNALKTQRFADETGLAGARTGHIPASIQNIQRGADIDARGIQGVGSGISSAATAYAEADERKKRQKRQDDLGY